MDKDYSYRFGVSIIMLLTNLFGQLFFKYYLNDVPLHQFNFLYLGNLFNLGLSFLIILGVILVYSINRGLERREFSLIMLVTLFAIASYFVGIIIGKSHYSYLNTYMFGYPARKVYLAILFIINLLSHFYLMAYIWGLIIGRQGTGSLKAFSISIFSLSIALVFSYYFVTSKNYKMKINSNTPVYDVAVILGAAVWHKNQPSTVFKGRIVKTYELYKRGKVRKIQLTGGNAPGEISEAQSAYDYLTHLGVDKYRIMMEEKTSTTAQQIQFIRDDLYEAKKMKSIAIISNEFHLARTLQMCKFFEVPATGIASDYNLSVEKLLYYRIRESIALLLFWLFGI